MAKVHIVLDAVTAERLHAESARRQVSPSAMVSEALIFYFSQREPDTTWIGSLKSRRHVGHSWKSIRRSVAARRRTSKPA